MALVAVLVGGTGRPAAAARPPAGCSASRGDLVVVDLRPWGGNLRWGCDPRPTTGLEALQVAGFTTAGDSQDGDAFVCRIDDDPTPAQQSCISTPPATAYWSYWHAVARQRTWTYSQTGAAGYRPPPGSIDAWVFGATNVAGTSGGPSFSPADARALEGSVSSSSGARGPASSGSSPAGFVAGAATVVVLGGAGLVAARRRRRHADGLLP
ncbi:MAG TPA: hypothetical protein VMB72_11430 [Acidimicrobiales bacterium]|nr:hypothetical protein [Acidimicrobiales bacterium]